MKVIKRIFIGVMVVSLLLVGVIYFYPQLIFSSGLTQKMLLYYEGDQVAKFYFKENQTAKDSVYMRGVIYRNTFNDIKEVLDENPEVTTLVMVDVPGSIDDEINLLASQELRKRNINTYIPKDGMVASGGTDMFLAGVERDAHFTAKLGVHSWSDGEQGGNQYPKDHPDHALYLEYYAAMEIPASFYWYTLDAAPAEEIHWMTQNEMFAYEVLTNWKNELLSLQKELSSDEYEGRAAGNNQKSQKLIIDYFKNIGLEKFNNTYASKFTFTNEKTNSEQHGTNIIGYLKGEKFPDKYIVIGAHYDHLGIVNDTIYNGADDNASGTSALLVLAKYFAEHRPQHSIIFTAFDAEELGLHGSKYFVENPPVPLEDIKLDFNFDMISRNPKNEIYVVGTYSYPQFKPIVEVLAEASPLQVSYGHDDPNDETKDYWMFSSDNGPFHEKGIPNITFSEEDHPAYHRPTDDFENINPEFFQNVVYLIQRTIESIDKNFPQ
ncbi:MAG: M28 family peptidase [Bacteroidota bacterium]